MTPGLEGKQLKHYATEASQLLTKNSKFENCEKNLYLRIHSVHGSPAAKLPLSKTIPVCYVLGHGLSIFSLLTCLICFLFPLFRS